MFGRKKKQPLFHEVEENRCIVHDFRLRSTKIGFESYRAVEYKESRELQKEVMYPKLADYLDRLCQGEIDEGNVNMLDGILLGPVREGVLDLYIQYYNHQDLLRRLDIREDSDYQDLSEILKGQEKVLQEMKEELKVLEEQIKNCGEVV